MRCVICTSICLVQVSGEHHNLTTNGSDRSTIDRAARLHAECFLLLLVYLHACTGANKRMGTQTWPASPIIDAAVLVMRSVVVLYRPMPGTSFG